MEGTGEKMQERLPEDHVIFDEHGCEHVIVINDNVTMAKVVAKMINATVDKVLVTDFKDIPLIPRMFYRRPLANLVL